MSTVTAETEARRSAALSNGQPDRETIELCRPDGVETDRIADSGGVGRWGYTFAWALSGRSCVRSTRFADGSQSGIAWNALSGGGVGTLPGER